MFLPVQSSEEHLNNNLKQVFNHVTVFDRF